MAYFFEGLEDPGAPDGDEYAAAWSRTMDDLLAEPNGKALAEAFVQIRRRSVRKGLVDLAREIAANDHNDAEDDRPKGRSAAE